MVKADPKHNYYEDLELPTTASIDDVRKAYRKLALQYHPDRNSGREEECVPKFQAIQSAIEILGEPNSKQKYDADRKRTGIHPVGQTFNPRQPAPGNPYAATSQFAPPPRRTQPGTWQRPQPAGGAAPNGADRFSNFPRPHPTARQDPAQDRANQFHKAWQNMNMNQNQTRPKPTAPPHQPPPQPQPQAQRQRPQPPPRNKPANVPSTFNYEQNKTAWQSFNDANAGRPPMPRAATGTTPRKAGFNPNVPGSDEKPADSNYHHRKYSAGKMPPPPSGPPPTSTPVSPISPTSHRPYPDPTRPHSSRAPNDQVPFAEGNRDRTPYASFIRERTDLGGDGLRRSYSTRDTTKLGPEDAASRGRARSVSPLRRQQRASDSHANSGSQQKAFDLGYSSSGSSENVTPNQEDSRPDTAPNTAPPFDRPRATPTPPSSRFNGARSGPTFPMPQMPFTNGGADGAQSEGERPNMQQKPNSNMYANPFTSVNNSSKFTKPRTSESTSTSTARRAWSSVGRWAIPSSVNPFARAQPIKNTEYVTAADEVYKRATQDEQKAFLHFQSNLEQWYEYIPDSFDMEVFLKLASTARKGTSCGDPLVDRLLKQTLSEFAKVGHPHDNNANGNVFGDRFHFPRDDDLFTPTSKSPSEENINMQFSDEPWKGAFGEQSFAPPPPTGRKVSPTRRTTQSRKEQSRAATMDEPKAPVEEYPTRPWGSDGRPKEFSPNSTPVGGFNQDHWSQSFQDSPFWPPPPQQKSGSPTRGGAANQQRKQSQGGRRASKAGNRGTAAKTAQQPQVVDEDDTVEVQGVDGQPEHGASVVDEPEPMDIDNTPPTQNGAGQQAQNEARLYNVPRSRRQEQEQKQQNTQRHRKTSSASRKPVPAANMKTNVDDLRNVEPISKSADAAGTGTYNFGDMSASLPFQSQAAPNLSSKIIKPNKLNMPPVPKAPAEPTKLTKTTWPAYVQSYAAYVKAFHDFNKTMIDHFYSREQLTDSSFLKDPVKWLEAVGDTSGISGMQTGFGSYAAMVAEDEGVRELWNVGCEKHSEAIKAFGRVRERVKKLAEGGGLADN